MPVVRRTRQSYEDYLTNHAYIAQHSTEAAARVVRRFDARLVELAHAPGAGRLRPELGQNVRSSVVGVYILFYRPTPDGIELLRVLHSARDIPRVFNNP
jgi:toxin ParE1/3/4